MGTEKLANIHETKTSVELPGLTGTPGGTLFKTSG